MATLIFRRRNQKFVEVVTYTLKGPTDDGQKYSHMSLAVLALDASSLPRPLTWRRATRGSCDMAQCPQCNASLLKSKCAGFPERINAGGWGRVVLASLGTFLGDGRELK